METATARVRIASTLGLHARPAMVLQDAAKSFEATVTVLRIDNGQTADAENMMGLLSLALLHDTEIEIRADGADAAAAVAELVRLVETKCGLE